MSHVVLPFFLPSFLSPSPGCCGWRLRRLSFVIFQRVLRDERRPQVGDVGSGDAAFHADRAKHRQLLVGHRRRESRSLECLAPAATCACEETILSSSLVDLTNRWFQYFCGCSGRSIPPFFCCCVFRCRNSHVFFRLHLFFAFFLSGNKLVSTRLQMCQYPAVGYTLLASYHTCAPVRPSEISVPRRPEVMWLVQTAFFGSEGITSYLT